MIPEYKYFMDKYPDVVDNGNINITKLGNLIFIVRQFDNDIESLKKLNLEYFLIDLQCLFADIKTVRKLKIKKLNNL